VSNIPQDELTLTGRAPLARSLHLRLARTTRLYVTLYPVTRGTPKMLAYASADLTECRLGSDSGGWVLWLDSTAFDVSATEAEKILAAYPTLTVQEREEPTGPTGLPYIDVPEIVARTEWT
jgi:hypothetical protein